VNTRGRLISGLVTTIMALAGFVTAGTLPAAATASPVQYVALGDSYAAGIGAPPYVPSSGGCLQSNMGYPALLDLKGRIDLQANATCPGATTTDVGAILDSPQNPLNSEIRLVTLTVGGADLHFSDVLTRCTLNATACSGAVEAALLLLRDLKINLARLYAQIAAAAPEARIVVTGYPLLFRDVEDPVSGGFSLDVINAVNNGGVALNKTIEDAVAAANEDGNIEYVDVTEEFHDHGVLLRVNNTSATHPADPSAFIHSPFIICDPTTDPDCKDPGDPAAYHPTDDGYDAYGDAISAALPGGWLKQDRSV
jgi:lysophospholipase L1-like esterase